MKVVSIILSVATVVLALSQLICGLWIRSTGSTPDAVSFHASLGIGTVVVALATIAAMWVLVGQRGKAQAR